MNPSDFVQPSWWRRLARRIRTGGAPRANRLSHFEPLEPRTVLSGGPWDSGFWRSPTTDPHFQRMNLQFGGPGEFGYAFDRPGPGGEFAPPAQRTLPGLQDDFGYQDGQFVSQRLSGQDSLTVFGGPINSGTTLSSSYAVQIVVVPDDHFSPGEGPSVTSFVSVAFSTPRPSLSSISLPLGSAMERLNTPVASFSFDRPAEAGSLRPGSVALSRLEDAEASVLSASKSAEAELTQGLSSGLAATRTLLVNLTTGHATLLNREQILVSRADLHADDHTDAAEHPAQGSGDETDGTTNLSAAELAQKKKATATAARTSVNGQLDRLIESPVIQITESLFRELLVMFDAAAIPQTNSPSAAPSDDGMIELLALDVSTANVRQARAATRPVVTLDSGVALAQVLEMAGLDDAADAVDHSQAQAQVAMVNTQPVVQTE